MTTQNTPLPVLSKHVSCRLALLLLSLPNLSGPADRTSAPAAAQALRDAAAHSAASEPAFPDPNYHSTKDGHAHPEEQQQPGTNLQRQQPVGQPPPQPSPQPSPLLRLQVGQLLQYLRLLIPGKPHERAYDAGILD